MYTMLDLEEITGATGEPNEYDIVTIRATVVSFVSFFRILSPRFNAATNSSLTRLWNKLAGEFELPREDEGEGSAQNDGKKGPREGKTR